MILITGAAGFIGSFLAKKLESDRCVGIDNFDPFYNISIKKDNLAGIMESNPSFVFYPGRFVESEFFGRSVCQTRYFSGRSSGCQGGSASVIGRSIQLHQNQCGGNRDLGGNHEKVWRIKNGFWLLFVGLW